MDPNSAEAGTSSNPGDTLRLPSFKGPRDLTLSSSSSSSSSTTQRVAVPGVRSSSSRKFAPNIPIKRERTVTTTEACSTSKNSNNNKNDRGNRDGRGGGRGRGGPNDRGRGGKRASDIYVQAAGAIFSQGIGDGSIKSKLRAPTVSSGGSRSGGGGVGGGYFSGVARKSDKNNQELMETIKEISNRNIMKSKYKQILGSGKSFISDLKQADEDGLEKAVTLPLSSCLSRLNADVPEEPITTRSLTPPSSSSSRKKRGERNTFASTVSKLPPDGTIILLQLPENLPYFLETSTEKEDNSSSEGGNSAKELAKTIKDIPEGLIAQFETLSTGESRIVMGNSCFELTAGTRPGFYQELLLDDEDGFTSLGAVQYKYIGIPNVESVLDSNVQS